MEKNRNIWPILIEKDRSQDPSTLYTANYDLAKY